MSTPKLTMFNTVTGFREAVSFIGFSCESEDSKVHIETFTNHEEDDLVYMKLTTDKGATALVDSTLKSECLDSDVYVNLSDFFVMCDKGVKDGLVALWVADGKLYLGSSYNEGLQCFESEVSLPMLEPFEVDDSFSADITVQVEQMVISSLIDACYNFETIEIACTEGTFSFRTGDERVCIATLPYTIKVLGVESPKDVKDFSAAIPVNVFKIMPTVNTDPVCSFDFDFSRKKVRVAGKLYAINYKYGEGKLRTGTSEGMTSYMKFDTLGMMATIDMIYGLNYKDPIAPVKLVPLDENTVEIKYGYEGRYAGTITMTGVKMMDTKKSIDLPMDVSTMMVRNAGTAVLEMLYSDDGRLFLTFASEKSKFARKCMYFGD